MLEVTVCPSSLCQRCNAAECPGYPEDAGTGPQDEAPADLYSHLHSLRQL